MIQVYTGNGKGKTTAALGLALRASGAGLKVYVGQFLKRGPYSEIKALKKFKGIKLEQFGSGYFTKKHPSAEDVKMACAGLVTARKAVSKGHFDIVILDEINAALNLKLLKLEDVTSFIKTTPKRIEIILTGRCAPAAIIKIADLVSEIKDRKHYYRKGIKARKGIEY